MDLWSIVKTVGTGLISTMVPGGPLIVAGINAVLPADQQLPANATGQQAMDAIESLPPAEQAAVKKKQYDVEITQIKESHDTVRTMLTADATMPQSTRPYIAKGSFHVVAFVCVMTVSLWAYGILKADTKMVTTIVNGWPFLLAAIGPLVVLLHAYFGVLKTEQKNKLDAANGHSSPAGLAGILSAFMGKK
jgi:hypothetical protein